MQVPTQSIIKGIGQCNHKVVPPGSEGKERVEGNSAAQWEPCSGELPACNFVSALGEFAG